LTIYWDFEKTVSAPSIHENIKVASDRLVLSIFTWLFDQFVMQMVIFFSGFMQLPAGWNGPGDIVES
jgi:hypothetical protein